MINPGNNPFKNAEGQQNDIMNSSWSGFNTTNEEVSKEDKEAADKERIITDAQKTTDFAKEAFSGHDTIDKEL